MAVNVRDAIRQKTVGAKAQFRTKVVEYEGLEVEFRQPNLRDRKALIARSRGESGEFDAVEFQVWAVILNTYVAGTNELVFEDTDYEVIMNSPSGGFVDIFAAEIAELLNVESDPKG